MVDILHELDHGPACLPAGSSVTLFNSRHPDDIAREAFKILPGFLLAACQDVLTAATRTTSHERGSYYWLPNRTECPILHAR
jgi:hypothetical protein